MTIKTPLRFVEHVRQRLAERDLALVLSPKATLAVANVEAQGVFHPEFGIDVAVDSPGWLAVLAHEFGHFEQFLADHPDWQVSSMTFSQWLDGAPVSFLKNLETCRAIQRLELDAERRALRYVRSYRLGDPAAYARRANRHVLAYELARRNRSWPAFSDASASAFPARLISESQIGDHPVLDRMVRSGP